MSHESGHFLVGLWKNGPNCFPQGLSAHQLSQHKFLQGAHPSSLPAVNLPQPIPATSRTPGHSFGGPKAPLLAGSSIGSGQARADILQETTAPKRLCDNLSVFTTKEERFFSAGQTPNGFLGIVVHLGRAEEPGIRPKATPPRMHSALPHQSETRILEGGRGREGAARRLRGTCG